MACTAGCTPPPASLAQQQYTQAAGRLGPGTARHFYREALAMVGQPEPAGAPCTCGSAACAECPRPCASAPPPAAPAAPAPPARGFLGLLLQLLPAWPLQTKPGPVPGLLMLQQRQEVLPAGCRHCIGHSAREHNASAGGCSPPSRLLRVPPLPASTTYVEPSQQLGRLNGLAQRCHTGGPA